MVAKRPTINDVAREAGVSKGTVSAVLNARDSVSDITRQRVLAVMGQLNYRPSERAGRSRSRRTAAWINRFIVIGAVMASQASDRRAPVGRR